MKRLLLLLIAPVAIACGPFFFQAPPSLSRYVERIPSKAWDQLLEEATPGVDPAVDDPVGAVRDFLEQTDCNACICGHIHEAVGTDRVGPALVINPGMISRGGYVLIECGSEKFSATLKKCKI